MINFVEHRIVDFCTLRTGGTPSTSVKAYYEKGTIPWLVSGDIHKGIITGSEKFITKLAVKNSNARLLPYNSVLIALNGQGKTRGTVALLRLENATCNQSLIAITPDESIAISEYIFYNLYYRYAEIRSMTGDNERSGLSISKVGKIKIPLPPLREQQRIVAEVERQLAFVEKANRAAIEQLEAADQLQSIQFNDFLSADSFSECKWIPIGECTTKVGSGATPRGGQSSYSKQGIPLIRSQNVHFNRFIEEGLVYISDAQNELLKRTVVQKGDVLLNITGASIGRVCVVPDKICPSNVNQHVCIIRFDGRFLPEFVVLYMSTRGFQKIIDDMQAGATRQALTKEQVQGLKLPIISTMRQTEIIKTLRSKSKRITRVRNELQIQNHSITAMPAAILRQAFSGNL